MESSKRTSGRMENEAMHRGTLTTAFGTEREGRSTRDSRRDTVAPSPGFVSLSRSSWTGNDAEVAEKTAAAVAGIESERAQQIVKIHCHAVGLAFLCNIRPLRSLGKLKESSTLFGSVHPGRLRRIDEIDAVACWE